MYLKNDATGEIIQSADYQLGYSPASAEEINEFLLRKAKFEKIDELRTARRLFERAGYDYQGNVFQVKDSTILNLRLVRDLPSTDPNRYKFYTDPPEEFDNPREQIDFGGAEAFIAFFDMMLIERNRVMMKYNHYRLAIDSCASVAEVEEIVIDFSA